MVTAPELLVKVLEREKSVCLMEACSSDSNSQFASSCIPRYGKHKNRLLSIDELRIIRFLLSDTVINTRINGATKERPFVSNIGTPQGDSLSPVLFSVYLENALKEVRTILPRPTNKLEKTLPTEIAYADDVDFVGLNFVDTEEVQNTLHKYNLLVNIDKDRVYNVVKSWNRV